jgi:hypothetical protein
MNSSQGRPQRTSNAPGYYASVVASQANTGNFSKDRAQRLYAIGELQAAAQLLSDLAAGRPRRRATDRGEVPNG